MEPDKRAWTDERVESVIGSLLRSGVMLAALIVIAGGILYLIRHGGETPGGSTFRGEPPRLRSVAGAVQDSLSGRGRAIIQLGLIILIATPVARVAFSVYAFARERDRLYVAVTLIVLSLLIFSLTNGRI